MAKKLGRLGSGKRFAALKAKMARQGLKNPAGAAAVAGRKKYGKKKFQAMATAGRKRATRKKK